MHQPHIWAWLVLCSLLTGCSVGDEAFLDDLQRRHFAFFWEQAHPKTGLIADRAPADGSNRPEVASIASVGFGLPGICIADSRGWITREQAYDRVLTTLRFLYERMPHERGFYSHFVNHATGERVWNCELSSIDTALLLSGVLTVRQYFPGTEVAELATKIYERVDWPWMMNGGDTLTMGWTPENGFLDARWNGYSELHAMYLMAIGSPTHPISPESWHAWSRDAVITYGGRTYVQCAALFTHQYPHAWVDFRHRRDAHVDYFRNSQLATQSQRQFCADQGDRFPAWNDRVWGLTSCDGPEGYRWMGGPPATDNPPLDGLVVPAAAGGSIPFAPRACIETLAHMRRRWGDAIYSHYGFHDSFNPNRDRWWVAPDVIGIDVGVTLLAAENHRTGIVWDLFMRNPEIVRAMRMCDIYSTDRRLPPQDVQYLRELAADTWNSIATMVAPETGLPYDSSRRFEWTSVSNIGVYFTAIAAAQAMGYVGSDEAHARLDRAIGSLENLKTWHGFQQSWNSVKTLAPAEHDPWVSILDSGNLAAGLIVVRQAYPRFRDRCDKLLGAMDWGAFYDSDTGLLCGGFNTATGQFNRQWRLNLLGTDARLAQFLAIAAGHAPVAMWARLDRSTETRHHAAYLVPGWQGGGLFMQYISGLWLDERDTLMKRSAQNFALAQIAHARATDLPVWGWSACAAPDGEYLGWGKLVDRVVTPHASVLALEDFPSEVVANLRRLEALGTRPGKLGFVDSLDLESGSVTSDQLVLDQGMILLSLANFLHDDVARRQFMSDPLAQAGERLIDDYRHRAYGSQVSVYRLAPLSPDLRDEMQISEK